MQGSIGALDQVVDQLFKLRAGQFHDQMLGPAGIRGDEGQIDLGFLRGGEFDLGAFGRFFQALERHAIFAQINALIFLELIDSQSITRWSKSSPPR